MAVGKKYSANIDFALNFEDKTPSTKVHKGDIISYDGDIATYFNKKTQEYISGSTRSLRGAIEKMHWLDPVGDSENLALKKKKLESPNPEGPKKREEYNEKIGGDFDEYSKRTFNPEVIKEDNNIVKETGSKKDDTTKKEREGITDISLEQNEVRSVSTQKDEKLIVSSSTAAIKGKEYSKEVISSDQMGAENSVPITSTPSAKREAEKKSEAPKPKRPVVYVDQPEPGSAPSNDGQVVAKVSSRKGLPIENQEGKTVEGITFKKVDAPSEMKITTKVSGTGDSVADLSEGSPDALVVSTTGSNDYLTQLPNDWGKIHWTKREKYVQTIKDQGFLKYIKTVDTTKAIQKACEKKMGELTVA